MRFRIVAALSVALLLAGCSGSKDDAASPKTTDQLDESPREPGNGGPEPDSSPTNPIGPAPGPPPSANASASLDEAFELSLREIFSPVTRLGMGTNCAKIESDQPFQVLAGNVQAEWQPGVAGADQLRLHVVDLWGDYREESVAQGTPLTHAFGPLPIINVTDDSNATLLFALQLPDFGAVWDQAVKMRVRFEFLGDGALAVSTSGCAVG